MTEALARSQPLSIDEVERLLEATEKPFDVDDRLRELADELQSEYPDHELTAVVIEAVEGDDPPSDERMNELIEDTEQLLEGVEKQLQRIQETMDTLENGSVILIELLD